MENTSSEKAVYNVLDDNVAFNLESRGSEYQSLGDRDRPTTGIYDSLEEPTMYATPIYINATDSKGDENNTQVCKRVVRNKTARSVTKRICIGLLVAMTVLLLISLLVMVYLFVFSKSEGGTTKQDSEHCIEQIHVENGKVVNTTGSKYGDVVEIECDERSQLIGSNLITCLSSGKWSLIPKCVPKKCGDFVLTNNMLLESKEEDPVVGTQIVVTCTEGFEIHGNKTIICQFDKSWSERPICKAIDCGMPKNIANAKITGLINTTYMYNRTFSVRCNKGYRLEGSKTISCQANGLWTTGATCTKELKDCLDILNEGGITIDGIYSITTWKSRQQRQVYCDMTTSGGGWTMFQYRDNGSVDFYRNFSEYENGFGSQDGEFWLGLRLVRELISLDTTELRIDVSAADKSTGFETFQNFQLSESPDYTINFEKVESSMENMYLGLILNKACRFSTYDHDFDKWAKYSCAKAMHGAWWYNECGIANLNGHYAVPGTHSNYHKMAGMIYELLENNYLSLKTSKMMFRRTL